MFSSKQLFYSNCSLKITNKNKNVFNAISVTYIFIQFGHLSTQISL